MKKFDFYVPKNSIRTLPTNKNYICNIPFTSWMNHRIPDENNPRSHEKLPRPTTAIKNGIMNTISECPELFHHINRGCLLIANDANYDITTETLTVVLTNYKESMDENGEIIKPTHGLADGGTTDKILADCCDDSDYRDKIKFVNLRVEIITDEYMTSEDVANICRGRNKSIAVKQWTLDSFNGKYDWLKKILDKEFPGKIAYDEYDDGVFILDVLNELSLLHKAREKNPTSAWNSKGSIPKFYENNSDGFKEMSNLIPDILRLRDAIILSSYQLYEDYYKSQGFKKKSLGTVKSQEGKKRDELFGKLKTPKKLVYVEQWQARGFPFAILFPLLYAFRALIDNGKWVVDDVFEFWAEHGGELLAVAIEEFRDSHKSNVHSFARDKGIFGQLSDRVNGKIKDCKNEKLMKELEQLRAKVAQLT